MRFAARIAIAVIFLLPIANLHAVNQDFHNAPRRQLIFLTSGILELEASDGKRTICLPGDLIFAEDMQGKGHITRSLRDVRGFVHVSMPDDFDLSAWPLLKS